MHNRIAAWTLLTATALGTPAAMAAPSAAELEQAGNLFAISCSSSFCHGEAGIGARGPALRDRNLPGDYIRNTMLQGRSGTAMPAFKDSLTVQEVNMIVAYVMSLSPNNHAGDGAAAAIPIVAPGSLGNQAQLGAAVFFDTSRPNGCGLCHSYGQRGGPVGPDLTGIAKKSARDIYQGMVAPRASDLASPAVSVTMPDGKQFTGISQFQDSTVVRLYDLSSAPPILRSLYPADGARIAASPAAPYAHDLSTLSKDQIAALIAFLKSTGGGPRKDVAPKDFEPAPEKR